MIEKVRMDPRLTHPKPEKPEELTQEDLEHRCGPAILRASPRGLPHDLQQPAITQTNADSGTDLEATVEAAVGRSV